MNLSKFLWILLYLYSSFSICWIIWNSIKFLVSTRNNYFRPILVVYYSSLIWLRTIEPKFSKLLKKKSNKNKWQYFIYYSTWIWVQIQHHYISSLIKLPYFLHSFSQRFWLDQCLGCFLKHRFKLEASFEIGNNWIESEVKPKAKSPK